MHGSNLARVWRRRLNPWLARGGVAWRRALDLLFPPRCERCQADLDSADEGILLCAPCRLLLGPAEWPCCAKCGAAAPPGAPQPEGCRLCRATPFHFATVVSLGGYQQAELRDAILRMKRPANEPLAVAMGRLLALRRGDVLRSHRLDFVVPIPMHWIRRLVRRTNPAETLALEAGRALGVPVARRDLRQARPARAQKSLTPRERFRNVRGIFRLARPIRYRGKRIALVDDVMTTGATASEAARLFEQAGAEIVVVAVLARAEGDVPS